MAVTVRVRKLSNPRRVKAKNTRRRRKMSPKQIRIFGTKAQKAALKRKRSTASRRKNPVRRVKVANRRKSRNPVILTLGAVNPKRSKNPVAKKTKNRRRRVTVSHRRRRSHRRAHNPRPVARRRSNPKRRNSTRVVVVSPRANRRRRHHHRRRNPPALFGHPLFGKDAVMLLGGGLVGVTATKFIPTLLPASLTGGIASSNIGRTVLSGVSAVVAGWAGSKVSPVFGQGMLYGGMLQTFSVLLNAFLPSIWTQLNPQLGGLGQFVDGSFPVPQIPVSQMLPPATPMPAPSQVRVGGDGLGRAYGSAY